MCLLLLLSIGAEKQQKREIGISMSKIIQILTKNTFQV